MVEVSNLLLGGLLPHYLDSGYICLQVWPWQGMPMALADKPLDLLLPLLSSMHDHSLENVGGSADLQHPIAGTHPKINWHLGGTPPLRLTLPPPLPTPWWQGTCAICPQIIALGVHGN